MSAAMAKQRDSKQLEQSDIWLVLNMAQMAKGEASHPTIEEMHYLINNRSAKIQEGKKRGVEFSGHKMVKAVIERHPAMLCQNHTTGCLSCQNRTAKNLQTCWRHKVTGAPPPYQHRQLTPKLTPCLLGTPPAPTCNNSGVQCSQMVNLAAGYAYSNTYLHCAEFLTLDASAQDSQHDTDFDPAMLTDAGTSTG